MTFQTIALVRGTDVKVVTSKSREVELRFRGYVDYTTEAVTELSYPELQEMAKAADIKANQSKDALVAALAGDSPVVETAEPVETDADDATDPAGDTKSLGGVTPSGEDRTHSLLDGPAAGETADFS